MELHLTMTTDELLELAFISILKANGYKEEDFSDDDLDKLFEDYEDDIKDLTND